MRRRARSSSTLADDLYLYSLRPRHGHAPDLRAGRGRRGDVQPGRAERRLRPRQRSLRRRSRRPRAAPHHRRQRGDPQRKARLGLPGRGLRPRQLARATGGAPTRRASPSCSSTSGRCRSTRSSTTSRTAATLKVYRLSEGRRSESARGAEDRAGERRDVVDVDNERYVGGEFLIVNVAWSGDGKTRHVSGAEPRADLARSRRRDSPRRQSAARSSARPRKPGSIPSATGLAAGRLVPLAVRAHRLAPPLSLQEPTAR